MLPGPHHITGQILTYQYILYDHVLHLLDMNIILDKYKQILKICSQMSKLSWANISTLKKYIHK